MPEDEEPEALTAGDVSFQLSPSQSFLTNHLLCSVPY
jgi:hypothetical protein